MNNKGFRQADRWFKSMAWVPMPFQYDTWEAYNLGKSGLVNAPTGSGKTYSILLAALIEYINTDKEITGKNVKEGLQLIWVTPIKALAKEILLSCDKAILGMNLPWKAEIRTGDSSAKERKSQLKNPPQILITTPESLHVIMATSGYTEFFRSAKTVVIDEWHELFGSKRGVQTELVIAKLHSLNEQIKFWGISATIGNMSDAVDVLLSVVPLEKRAFIIADMHKKIELHSVYPDEIERYPWAGHLGLKLADKVLNILNGSKTSLIFTNTRAQCEIWYQKLLEMDPDLAGQIAMHHGSISKEIREWVEDALYEGKIKAVVCTSSLDLGVDFRPVETIIQIGSPKGVSRFVQRAGRSGHQPGAASHIWFVPTHALELIEAAGLRLAITQNAMEERIPYIRSFDVLTQYLMTLAVSEGFYPDQTFLEIKKTYSFASVSQEEWSLILNYLLIGGDSLKAYDEYKKVEITDDGKYIVQDKRKALKHKLSIGT